MKKLALLAFFALQFCSSAFADLAQCTYQWDDKRPFLLYSSEYCTKTHGVVGYRFASQDDLESLSTQVVALTSQVKSIETLITNLPTSAVLPIIAEKVTEALHSEDDPNQKRLIDAEKTIKTLEARITKLEGRAPRNK
jgi:hypothetical protein